MGKDKGGRPTVMTQDVLRKLEEIFVVNGSDEDACFYAGISTQPLYDYQRKHPEYAERKYALKNMPKLKAKKVLNEALAKKDKDVAKFILERTDKEYKNKTNIDVENKTPIIVVESEEHKKKLEKLAEE